MYASVRATFCSAAEWSDPVQSSIVHANSSRAYVHIVYMSTYLNAAEMCDKRTFYFFIYFNNKTD